MKAIKDSLVILIPNTTHTPFEIYRKYRDKGILLDAAKVENFKILTFDEFEKLFNNDNDIQYNNFILFVDPCVKKQAVRNYEVKTARQNFDILNKAVNNITENLSVLLQTVDTATFSEENDIYENENQIVDDKNMADFVEEALEYIIPADNLLDKISYKMLQ